MAALNCDLEHSKPFNQRSSKRYATINNSRNNPYLKKANLIDTS